VQPGRNLACPRLRVNTQLSQAMVGSRVKLASMAALEGLAVISKDSKAVKAIMVRTVASTRRTEDMELLEVVGVPITADTSGAASWNASKARAVV